MMHYTRIALGFIFGFVFGALLSIRRDREYNESKKRFDEQRRRVHESLEKTRERLND